MFKENPIHLQIKHAGKCERMLRAKPKEADHFLQAPMKAGKKATTKQAQQKKQGRIKAPHKQTSDLIDKRLIAIGHSDDPDPVFRHRANRINENSPDRAIRMQRLLAMLNENKDLVAVFDEAEHCWPMSIDNFSRDIGYFAIDDKDRLVVCATR